MSALSFMEERNERHLPADYQGDLLLWDIDKTYLDTHFSSWRGLLRIPLELAIDKEAIPGTVPLLRALRRGTGEQSALVPLYFISGSPLQLRRVVERKMTIDGVDYDGITMKDQLGLVLAGRPSDVKAQIGYKLKALLSLKRQLPDGARWFLFGDDSESDAQVFALFGEVCRGLRGGALAAQLEAERVHAADVREIGALAGELSVSADPVEHIFIHLERGSDPSRFQDPRLYATRSYLQTAILLAQLGRVRPETIAAVAKDLRRRGRSEADLGADLVDVENRLGARRELCVLGRSP